MFNKSDKIIIQLKVPTTSQIQNKKEYQNLKTDFENVIFRQKSKKEYQNLKINFENVTFRQKKRKMRNQQEHTQDFWDHTKWSNAKHFVVDSFCNPRTREAELGGFL